jgi:hypothetical protein
MQLLLSLQANYPQNIAPGSYEPGGFYLRGRKNAKWLAFLRKGFIIKGKR